MDDGNIKGTLWCSLWWEEKGRITKLYKETQFKTSFILFKLSNWSAYSGLIFWKISSIKI